MFAIKMILAKVVVALTAVVSVFTPSSTPIPPTPTPIVQTASTSENLTLEASSTPISTPASQVPNSQISGQPNASLTPTPTPVATPTIEEAKKMLEEAKNLISQLPDETPTPQVVYVTPTPTPIPVKLAPTPTPSPTPVPPLEISSITATAYPSISVHRNEDGITIEKVESYKYTVFAKLNRPRIGGVESSVASRMDCDEKSLSLPGTYAGMTGFYVDQITAEKYGTGTYNCSFKLITPIGSVIAEKPISFEVE